MLRTVFATAALAATLSLGAPADNAPGRLRAQIEAAWPASAQHALPP